MVAADSDRTGGLEQTLELMRDPSATVTRWHGSTCSPTGPDRSAIVIRSDPLPSDAPARPTGRRFRGAAYPRPVSQPPQSRLRTASPPPCCARRACASSTRSLARRDSPPAPAPDALAPYFFPLDASPSGTGCTVQRPRPVSVRGPFRPGARAGALRRAHPQTRAAVYLAVFKRSARVGGPLSFPIEGWTLAADMPAAAPGLGAALDELDEVVAGCGGRVYLTKDARLRREIMGDVPRPGPLPRPARARRPRRGAAL